MKSARCKALLLGMAFAVLLPSLAEAQSGSQQAYTVQFLTAWGVPSDQGTQGQNNLMYQILKKYQKEKNSRFNIEFQAVPDRPAYLAKLNTLVASDSMPDWINLDATAYAQKLANQGLLADAEKLLTEFGIRDRYQKAALDYQRFENGRMFLIPFEYNTEMFWYNKRLFAASNLQAPQTFDEFLAVCQKLKSRGVTPISVAGKEGWPMIRYLSFVPFRLAGNDYIEKLKRGKVSMSDPVGMAGIDFVVTLGTKGYFQTDFANTDYTTAKDLFFGGKAAIWYIGTWEAGSFVEKNLPNNMKGNIGYFQLPMTANSVTRPNDHWAHSGLGFGVNAKKLNAAQKDFLRYFLPLYNDMAFQFGLFPPMKESLPADAPDVYKALVADLNATGQYAMCWDVRLDPATTDLLGSEINALALGLEAPKDFAKKMDASIKENWPKYF